MHTEVSVTRLCYLKQVDKKTNMEFSSVATSRPVTWRMIFLNEVFFWFPVKNRFIFLLSIPNALLLLQRWDNLSFHNKATFLRHSRSDVFMCSVKHVKCVQDKTFGISSSSASGGSTSALLYLDKNIYHKSSMSTLGNRFTIPCFYATYQH